MASGGIPPAPFIDMARRSEPEPDTPDDSPHHSSRGRKESTATERLRALHAKATAKLHEKLHSSDSKKEPESSKTMQDRLMYQYVVANDRGKMLI
jgi:predicted ferric reductase